MQGHIYQALIQHWCIQAEPGPEGLKGFAIVAPHVKGVVKGNFHDGVQREEKNIKEATFAGVTCRAK